MKPEDPEGTPASSYDALKAYTDALILAEPLQMELWRAYRVTIMQFRVLRILQSGPKVAGRLAEAAGMQPASLTRVLDRLEAEGFTSRLPDPTDRRRVRVRLTPRAQELLTHRLWLGTAFEAAFEAMDGEERRAFVASVRAFVRRVRSLSEAEEASSGEG